ncbi:cytosolic carboxypeptidase 1-like isoform X1 [Branchiostoma floridae x Branchiostoma japonicum]
MRRCKSSKRPHQQVRVYVLASHLLNGPSLSRGGQRSRRRSNPSPSPPDMSGKQTQEGSRLSSVLQSLERQIVTKTYDVEQVRYLTSKVLHFVQTQEKVRKDIMQRGSHGLEVLLATLERSTDTSVSQNVVAILSELVCSEPRRALYGSTKRASILATSGACQVLLRELVRTARESPVCEEHLLSLHSILAKIGQKDRKFAVKARLCGTLSITLGLVRNHPHSSKILTPTMQVLKLYAANVVNASLLGKSGAVSIVFRVMTACGKKYTSILKLALDTLALLMKSKTNGGRAVAQGGVPVLLGMFYDLHRLDVRHRQTNVKKAILTVLKNITNLKTGRRAFIQAEGIRILHTTSQETLNCKALEPVINLSSIIMRKCFPKQQLPLLTLNSTYKYHLPGSGGDTGDGPQGILPQILEEDLGDDSDDDDISIGEEEAELARLEALEQEEKEDVLLPESRPPSQEHEERPRTAEEIFGYEKFFPELREFRLPSSLGHTAHDRRCSEPTRPPPPIYIPTAGTDSSHLGMRDHHVTQSWSQVPHSAHAKIDNECSLPSIPKHGLTANRYSDPDFVAHELNSIRLSDEETFPSMDRRSIGSSHSNSTSSGFSSGGGSRESSSSDWRGGKSVRENVAPYHDVEQGSDSAHGSFFLPHLTAAYSSAADGENSRAGSRTSYSDKSSAFQSHMQYNRNGLDFFDYPKVYARFARRVRSVVPFNKLAYPDLAGHVSPDYAELQTSREFGVQRRRVFEDIDRLIHPKKIINRVIYDLDNGIGCGGDSSREEAQGASLLMEDNRPSPFADEAWTDVLRFNSQFESGNLRKAVQIRKYEYDLILNSDINTNHHHQWFYFEVSGMREDVSYTFNIVNCEKANSQFNFGMQPVMYSVLEAVNGQPGWVRAGKNICYYKNHFARSAAVTGGQKGKSYYTFSFSVKFPHRDDICYFAYHYPFTYSTMLTNLQRLESSVDYSSIYYRQQTLCDSLGGNPCPVLTITARPDIGNKESLVEFNNRQYIFLSARVHPGESNSSWVMNGTLDFLLSDDVVARQLRETYIFKIIPMLNPDGVINGSHRVSLSGDDLNRCYLYPSPEIHPTIYHTKGLLQYLKLIGKLPLVYCDYHGHSRKKNVFMYGCSQGQDESEGKENQNPGLMEEEDNAMTALPRILDHFAQQFCWQNCNFAVEKSKEGTGRVVVWRMGVTRSYTMESTYCGCDQGRYKGLQISTEHLEEMGRRFCEALLKLHQPDIYRPAPLPTDTMDLSIYGYAYKNSRRDKSSQAAGEARFDSSTPSQEEEDQEETDDLEEHLGCHGNYSDADGEDTVYDNQEDFFDVMEPEEEAFTTDRQPKQRNSDSWRDVLV